MRYSKNIIVVIWSNVIGISDPNVMFKGPGPLHEVGISDSNLGVLLFFLNTDSIERLCAFLLLPPSFSPLFFHVEDTACSLSYNFTSHIDSNFI